MLQVAFCMIMAALVVFACKYFANETEEGRKLSEALDRFME